MKNELVWFGVLVDGEYCWFSWWKEDIEEEVVWKEEFDFWTKRVMEAEEIDKDSMSPYLEALPKNERVSGNYADMIDAFKAWDEWNVEEMRKWGLDEEDDVLWNSLGED